MVILCGFFFISSWFKATVTGYWKHFLSFYWQNLMLLFCFIVNQENIYDSPSFGWKINIIEDKVMNFNGFFQIILISIKEQFKKFFYNFICFIINHDFYVITFWMHYTLFIISIFEKIKLIVIVNWTFQVSDILSMV